MIQKSLIVMDNASFHKAQDMQKIIEGSGHTHSAYSKLPH